MFYLTLPSNSSMEYYPDNSASHYHVKLPQDINLTGEYEVGLSEILFSNTYFNIREWDCYFNYLIPEKDSEEATPQESSPQATASNQPDDSAPSLVSVVIPGGLYESNEHFTHTLNTSVKKILGNQNNGHPKVKFYYNKASKKASLTIYESKGQLRLSPSLQRILGIHADNITGPGSVKGNYIMDLNEDFKSVYVYSDLVSARPVGDTMAPLLRIVPMSEKKKELVYRLYEKPHYVPLSRFQFNTTEILLTTDKGQPISFSSGSTIVTLHFRRKRPDHY